MSFPAVLVRKIIFPSCIFERVVRPCVVSPNHQEFDELEAGADVYKLVGPVLVKQSVDEAKVDVERRLEFIGGEMYVPEQRPARARRCGGRQRLHRRELSWFPAIVKGCVNSGGDCSGSPRASGAKPSFDWPGPLLAESCWRRRLLMVCGCRPPVCGCRWTVCLGLVAERRQRSVSRTCRTRWRRQGRPSRPWARASKHPVPRPHTVAGVAAYCVTRVATQSSYYY